MCIVIDTNTLSSVFDPTNEDHAEFEPVSEWVQHGKGFMVFGGTKYRSELLKAFRFLKLIVQLKTAQRAVELDPIIVDSREEQLKEKLLGTNCDDHHIIAILCTSGCKLLCSKDKRSFRFVKDRSNYLGSRKAPSIYSRRKHANLLTKSNIIVIRNEKQ